MIDTKPLGLGDEQFQMLMDTAAQLHPLDREPFLNAVTNLFAGRREVGEGEFVRGLRDGHFKWAAAPSHSTKWDASKPSV
jgi:hypothetical protein